ncbi:MAG: epoxyqueuosine reductase [Anaerolineales bacterium]|nr:epoxyqueuosine reductase [Anaerolineales bacterium]
MNSTQVKQTATRLGATLCGIATADRFHGAPEGFHPTDVLPECKSVIVLARRFLKSTLEANSTIPYTDIRNYLTARMDEMAIRLAYELEDRGITAVPINAIGPCEWNHKTGKSSGIISLKHAAELAGLGRIGRNTLLINDRYGNMIWLSAVLASVELEPDPMATYEVCPPDCTLCLDQCPVKALDGVSMDQLKCWEYAFGKHNGGEWRIKCFICRKICPNVLGLSVDW